eukprot:Tbor_TRINITY_DN5240_c1_g5::TRINITY_DN5240_c1_g5_i1::g.16732::m.16732
MAITASRLLRCPRVRVLVDLLAKPKCLQVSQISRKLCPSISETIGDDFGGLLNFLKAFPEQFTVAKSNTGSWHATLVDGMSNRSNDREGIIHRIPHIPVSLEGLSKYLETSIIDLLCKLMTLQACGMVEVYHVDDSATSSYSEKSTPLSNYCSNAAVQSDSTSDISTSQQATSLRSQPFCDTTNDDCSIENDPNVTKTKILKTTNLYIMTKENNLITVPQHLSQFEIHEYNSCRMARYLNCDTFTSVDDIKKVTSNIINQQVELIAISNPKWYACEEETVQIGGLVLANGAYFPRDDIEVACDRHNNNSNNNNKTYISQHNKNTFIKVKEVKGVKFTVTEDGLGEAGVSEKYKDMTLDELKHELTRVHGTGKANGFKNIKIRRRIIKAMLVKRNPNGSPLWEPPVTAYLLYDIMQDLDPGYHRAHSLREHLPEGGRLCCSTNNDFFRRFPHLFNVNELSSVNMTVQRADCGPKPVMVDIPSAALALSVLSKLPYNYDDNRAIYFSVILSTMTSHEHSEIKRKHETVFKLLVDTCGSEHFRLGGPNGDALLTTKESIIKCGVILNSKLTGEVCAQ